jgi:hypothetical protein
MFAKMLNPKKPRFAPPPSLHADITALCIALLLHAPQCSSTHLLALAASALKLTLKLLSCVAALL